MCGKVTEKTKRMQWWCVVMGILLMGGCSEGPASVSETAPRSSQKVPVTTRVAPAPSGDPAPIRATELTEEELVTQGRAVYEMNCTACHNLNPDEKGSLGPAVAGSSEALIEARVVRGGYPPGYTPKAKTRLMVALPYLAKDVKALSAYLQSVPTNPPRKPDDLEALKKTKENG